MLLMFLIAANRGCVEERRKTCRDGGSHARKKLVGSCKYAGAAGRCNRQTVLNTVCFGAKVSNKLLMVLIAANMGRFLRGSERL